MGNIDPNKVERRDLIEIFSQYGNVLGVSVHKGFAFVQMDSERNANRAVNEENGSVVNGQKIRKLFTYLNLFTLVLDTLTLCSLSVLCTYRCGILLCSAQGWSTM